MRAHGRKGSASPATATLSSPATQCAVPACSSQRNLRDHHLRGIHQGRVRAWGTAPDDVTREVGVHAGRAPLLRPRGDEYLAS